MSEIRIVEDFGIKVDARAAVLLETVMDFGVRLSTQEKTGGRGGRKTWRFFYHKLILENEWYWKN